MTLSLLALIPLIALLVCLMGFKLSVPKSGAIALAFALGLALGFFGLTWFGLSIAIGKALWLALFVSLIVWNALLLYHLVSDFGAIEVVNNALAAFLKEKFVAFLLLAWLFTGLLQGIAGFGVPSVITAPILIALGFKPMKAVVACLIGHAWAVTFGSMGTAYFVIQGITGIPDSEFQLPLWIFNTTTIVLTGACVCWVHSGFKSLIRGLTYVIPTAAVMSGVQYALLRHNMFHLATILTAAVGVVTMFTFYRIRAHLGKGKSHQAHHVENFDTNASKTVYKLNLLQSVLPYTLILILLLSFQAIPQFVRDAVAIAPSFPSTQTALAEPTIVEAAVRYNPIRLFVHPAFVLLIASVTACTIYKRAGVWDKKTFRGALTKTRQKGIPATLALAGLGSMALVMMDSGMTLKIAETAGDLTGDYFSLLSPFLGVLSTFITGNNTNANILFGELQKEIAEGLGVNSAMMTASQSISAGLGVAMGPTIVLMVALTTKQPENVSQILKKLIPLVLFIAAMMGIINFILIGRI
ncbi:MAG: L-lactate permease [Oscillospiraceae bacterium]|nr:L-lactate permease [Oscillospiraceae bacterium]